MIIWHLLIKGTDYIWMRPALLARKFRSMKLRAGLPTSHAKRGSAYEYNIPEKRAEERGRVEAAEQEYANFASRWRAKPRVRKDKLKLALLWQKFAGVSDEATSAVRALLRR